MPNRRYSPEVLEATLSQLLRVEAMRSGLGKAVSGEDGEIMDDPAKVVPLLLLAERASSETQEDNELGFRYESDTWLEEVILAFLLKLNSTPQDQR